MTTRTVLSNSSKRNLADLARLVPSIGKNNGVGKSQQQSTIVAFLQYHGSHRSVSSTTTAAASTILNSSSSSIILSNRNGSETFQFPNKGQCMVRWQSSTSSKTEEEYDDDDDDDDELEDEEDEIASTPIHEVQEDGSILLYTSPMGSLISRLKIVSITSCFMSIIGLPCLIYLKNGDWPNMQQMGLGGVAFLGATGSTVALHFVFGPYILDLYQLPQQNADSTDDNEEEGDDTTDSSLTYKATTRSVFGWKNEYTFQPLTDISPYAGTRPFANFVANDIVFYAHPEMLSDEVRIHLLHSKPNEEESDETSEEIDREGNLKTKKSQKKKKKQEDDDDDGFL